MAWTDNRDNTELRTSSGNVIALKDGDAEWLVPANLASQKLSRKSSSITGKYVNGYEWTKRGSLITGVEAVFTQFSKTVMDSIDELDGKIVEFIIYNGIGDDGNMQAIYSPEAEIIVDADVDMNADSAQLILVRFAFLPQTAPPSVTPSTDFPGELGFVGDELITGKNNLYVIVEESTAPAP